MKKILAVIINSTIRLLEIFSSSLKYKTRARLASLFGSVIYLISSKRKKITLENLKHAYPDKSNDWLSWVAKNSFRNISITFFELLALRKYRSEQVYNQIHYENLDLITKARGKGNGVILMSGHYGNWELLALSAGLFSGLPVMVVVQRQKYWDKQITESRTKFGNSVVERGSAARKLVAALRNNEAVALLADQSPPEKDGIYVDFFGRRTLTYKAPAELALKFKTPIVAGFAVRNQDFTYTVKLEEVNHEDLEYSDKNIQILTQRYTNLLENNIKENPHLWSWQHRRWKKTPQTNI
jgi:Kdo2-lipid IVA lauroyltransferase/acyltransferase